MAPYEPLPVQLTFLFLAMVETHGPVATIADIKNGMRRLGWNGPDQGVIALNLQDLVRQGYLEQVGGEKFPTAVKLTKEGRNRVEQGCLRLDGFSHFIRTKIQWEKLEDGKEEKELDRE